MRVIFVPVADRPECAVALNSAFDLAARLNASVVGCHIRPHRYSDVSLTEEFGALAGVDAVWEAAFDGKKTKKSATAAEALFAKVAQSQDCPQKKKLGASPGATWMEKVGSPDKIMSIMGPVSDLLIVSRPPAKGGKLARVFMLTALMNSSRPVLVLPQSSKKPVGRRISIAWNQSAEAARAVAAAMPLLQIADEVNIITCGPEDSLGPKSTHLAAYLRTWGVKTKCVRAKGSNDGKELVKGFRETKSDLLVMGAYSRSRLREKIFGGVTDHILNKSNIPVLMLHS